MAQYNIARRGGVETIEVSIISAMTMLYCLVTAALAGSGCQWGVLRNLQLTRRTSLDGCLQLAFCMLFAAESEHVTLVPLVSVLHAAFAPNFG